MSKVAQLTYCLKRDHRDIFVEFDSASRKKIETALKLPPYVPFLDALNSAHRQSRPHIDIKQCTWNRHADLAQDYWDAAHSTASSFRDTQMQRRLKRILAPLDPGRSTVKYPDQTAQSEAISTFEAALTPSTRTDLERTFRRRLREHGVSLQSWSLTWYWKALFTALPLIHARNIAFTDNATEQQVKVRISQVRQWTLVLVYSQHIRKDGKGDWVPVRELLRPPLFGKSYRYSTWDQYFSLSDPRFQRKIGDAWEAIPKRYVHDVRKYREEWYVLGRHDMTFTVTNFEQDKRRGAKVQRLTATADLESELYPFRGELWEMNKLQQELFSEAPRIRTRSGAIARTAPPRKPDASYICYPYDLVSIPVCQREKREGDRLSDGKIQYKEERILLSSDAVCEAYALLSEIWNDPTAKSVLVIAPPGSGKELLAESIHRFQHFQGPYIRHALSPSMHERNDAVLFGRSLGALASTHGDPMKLLRETAQWASEGEPSDKEVRPQGTTSDGLVFKAREGVLFLDEIDKVPEQTRASLLRLLENNEFAVSGTSIVLKLKRWCPSYVFAGSSSQETMFKLEPPDFWTRVSHVVEIQHPLDIDDELERVNVTKDYFLFFWMKRVADFFLDSKLLPFKYGDDTCEYFEEYYKELCTLLNDYDAIDCIAQMFAEEIENGAAATRMSVRGIRSTVGRVFYGLVNHLLYGRSLESSLEAMRRANGVRGMGWCEMLGWMIKWPVTAHPRIRPLATIEAKHGDGFRAELRRIVQVAIREINT